MEISIRLKVKAAILIIPHNLLLLDVPFGIIPLEIDEVYPLAQNEAPSIMDEDSKLFVKKAIESYAENFKEVIISENLINKFNLEFELEDFDTSNSKIDFDDKEKIKVHCRLSIW